MTTRTRGHCLCGATNFDYGGAPAWSCYCHCDDCRRNCAAPVVAWIGVATQDFRWTGQSPQIYASSPGVKRQFCKTCGTPMAFEAAHYPSLVHLYTATLDTPDQVQPTFHVWGHDQIPWLHLRDDLKRYPRSLHYVSHMLQGD